ncbi:hypothetical protein [Motilimonas eburnea]|uniref:hypothetical protein n=1 Tax=Motilimonas eburnea TaxID=1737488 RepID=UPI001E564A7A|nr:hypothetical protein [Motilimonas eburnea]MCE2572714.1 hypothetical protein [Motilimonas eburnea]
MKTILSTSFAIALYFICFAGVAAPAPYLAFTDLISGPQSGLGDGKGEGTIITLWGYRLGDDPGTITLTDEQGKQHLAAHIYYWKKADGQLPGGPADLWRSHELYELAFSLPASLPEGPISISLTTDAGFASDNQLPFTVRSGRIFHVKDGGDNTASGQFNDPWQFISRTTFQYPAPGNGGLEAGDIVYSHGVREVMEEEPRPGLGRSMAGMWLVQLEGTAERQIAIASYPATQGFVSGSNWGIHPYLSTGLVISKYRVEVGHQPDLGPNAPVQGVPNAQLSNENIRASRWGRIIGNYLLEREGMCADGFAGAIVSNGHQGDGLKALGNHIFDHGCDQTSHFQHTTYITVRQDGAGKEQLDGWEFAWNHLENNKAKFGLHFYDQMNHSYDQCLGFKPGAVLKAHNNYIINQKGSGINVHNYSRELTDEEGNKTIPPCWQVDVEIYNNVIINSGLGPVGELNNGTAPYGITAGGHILGKFDIFNNTISGVSDESARQYDANGHTVINEPDAIKLQRWQPSTFRLFNNLVDVDFPMPYLTWDDPDPKEGALDVSHNLWFNTTTESWSQRDSERFLQNTAATDEFIHPAIAMKTPLKLEQNSPALNGGMLDAKAKYDFYGVATGSIMHRGAVNGHLPAKPMAPQGFKVTKLEM